MPSLTRNLLAEPKSEKVARSVPAEVSVPDQGSAQNPVERDALQAAELGEKFAAQITAGMEKVASRGGVVDPTAGEVARTLLKMAHYVRESLRAAAARQKYAEYCLNQAALGAQRSEALKLASEMHADGLIDVSDGRTFDEVVEDLSSEDLRVYKRAVDLVSSGRLTRFGEVDSEKQASDANASLGDDVKYDWLLR